MRVNVFGSRVLAADAETADPRAAVDYRLEIQPRWREHTLPGDVAERLVLLLREMGLRYGCIDLIQKPDGDYVFLEVNPSGQFLFLEIEIGQKVSEAMAELLIDPRS